MKKSAIVLVSMLFCIGVPPLAESAVSLTVRNSSPMNVAAQYINTAPSRTYSSTPPKASMLALNGVASEAGQAPRIHDAMGSQIATADEEK